tara:strand:- start:486 stop:641 length:156 start_codon:yes stop_codon:yes gene_type:complete
MEKTLSKITGVAFAVIMVSIATDVVHGTISRIWGRDGGSTSGVKVAPSKKK